VSAVIPLPAIARMGHFPVVTGRAQTHRDILAAAGVPVCPYRPKSPESEIVQFPSGQPCLPEQLGRWASLHPMRARHRRRAHCETASSLTARSSRSSGSKMKTGPDSAACSICETAVNDRTAESVLEKRLDPPIPLPGIVLSPLANRSRAAVMSACVALGIAEGTHPAATGIVRFGGGGSVLSVGRAPLFLGGRTTSLAFGVFGRGPGLPWVRCRSRARCAGRGLGCCADDGGRWVGVFAVVW
jgi:hypothetical protein